MCLFFNSLMNINLWIWQALHKDAFKSQNHEASQQATNDFLGTCSHVTNLTNMNICPFFLTLISAEELQQVLQAMFTGSFSVTWQRRGFLTRQLWDMTVELNLGCFSYPQILLEVMYFLLEAKWIQELHSFETHSYPGVTLWMMHTMVLEIVYVCLCLVLNIWWLQYHLSCLFVRWHWRHRSQLND